MDADALSRKTGEITSGSFFPVIYCANWRYFFVLYEWCLLFTGAFSILTKVNKLIGKQSCRPNYNNVVYTPCVV